MDGFCLSSYFPRFFGKIQIYQSRDKRCENSPRVFNMNIPAARDSFLLMQTKVAVQNTTILQAQPNMQYVFEAL